MELGILILDKKQVKGPTVLDSINELKVDELRQELWYYMQDNPTNINSLCKEIGIGNATLQRFLDADSKRGPDLKVQLMVKKFLREKYAIRDEEIFERFSNGQKPS